MKKILTLLIFWNILLFASNSDNNVSENRAEKQIQKEMEKEKRYAQEKTFYQAHDYDFKGAEVNQASVDSLPDLEEDYDFNMDSVYD